MSDEYEFNQAEPFTSYMPTLSCGVCGFVLVADTESAAKVAAYLHVVRNHPADYERVTGHPPEDEEVNMTVYGLLEGLLTWTEVGP